MDLYVEAEVKPTESGKKVAGAIRNLFPLSKIKKTETKIVASGDSKKNLETFRELLQKQGMGSSAIAFLLKKAGEGEISFDLNKQAAYMGKVNFVDFEMPLGTIKVNIKEERIEDLIIWLAT